MRNLLKAKFILFFAFALSLLLIFIIKPEAGAMGDSPGGKDIFVSRGCKACHDISLQISERRVTIEEFLKSKGPELSYAGSKFKRAFLRQWLSDPEPIRPMRYNSLTEKNEGTHPKLAKGEAAIVADFLIGLKHGDKTQVPVATIDSGLGKELFNSRFSCYGCHRVRRGGLKADSNEVTGGLTGPSLVGAGARLRQEWVYSYLINQRAFTPVSRMPVYAGIISEAEATALAEYVSSLK